MSIVPEKSGADKWPAGTMAKAAPRIEVRPQFAVFVAPSDIVHSLGHFSSRAVDLRSGREPWVAWIPPRPAIDRRLQMADRQEQSRPRQDYRLQPGHRRRLR